MARAAANHDLTVRQGSTLDVVMRMFSGPSVADLTAAAFRARLHLSADPSSAAAQIAPSVAVTDAARGLVALTLPASHGLDVGTYGYWLDRTDGDEVRPLLYGALRVLGGPS